MIVWFFHVKVGHRQTPIPKPPTDVGGFLHAYRFRDRGEVTGIGILINQCLLSVRAFLLFKLRDNNYVVILEHKVPKVTVNCLEYLKLNGICVNMS